MSNVRQLDDYIRMAAKCQHSYMAQVIRPSDTKTVHYKQCLSLLLTHCMMQHTQTIHSGRYFFCGLLNLLNWPELTSRSSANLQTSQFINIYHKFVRRKKTINHLLACVVFSSHSLQLITCLPFVTEWKKCDALLILPGFK